MFRTNRFHLFINQQMFCHQPAHTKPLVAEKDVSSVSPNSLPQPPQSFTTAFQNGN